MALRAAFCTFFNGDSRGGGDGFSFSPAAQILVSPEEHISCNDSRILQFCSMVLLNVRMLVSSINPNRMHWGCGVWPEVRLQRRKEDGRER